MFSSIKLGGLGVLKCRRLLVCCQFKSGPVWQKLKISFRLACMKQISAVSFVLIAELLLIKSPDHDKCSCSSEHLRGPLSIANWAWTMFSLLEEASWPQLVRQMSGSLRGDGCISSCCLWARKGHKSPKITVWHLPYSFQPLDIKKNSCVFLEIKYLIFTNATTPVKSAVTCLYCSLHYLQWPERGSV